MSEDQMVSVPRKWLAAYLDDDSAKVEVSGESTSLWELLSDISTRPAAQYQGEPVGVLTIEVEGSKTSIDYDWHANVSKLPAGRYELHFPLVAKIQGDSAACDPCEWTDRQVLDFLGVALRNVDLVGEVRLSEIRQGFEYMRNNCKEENLVNKQG